MISAACLAWVMHYNGLAAAPPRSFGFVAGAPRFSSVSKIDDPFWPVFVRDARALGVDPRDLAAVMLAESGLNPRAANIDDDPRSRTFHQPVAIGLNQLARSNWGRFLGDISPSDYLDLPASVQWSRVACPFFRGVIERNPAVRQAVPENRARDLYWLNYRPATYRPDAPEDFPIVPWKVGDGDGVLVVKGDDAIRPAGLRAFLERSKAQSSARWGSILSAIDATEAGLGPPMPANVPGGVPEIPRSPAQDGPGAPIAQEPGGMGLGTVLAIGAGVAGIWFVWSSYTAGARLKGAILAPVHQAGHGGDGA